MLFCGVHVEVMNSDEHTTCALCGAKFTRFFVDGKTRSGQWADMCPTCHVFEGLGIGTGIGQKYELKNGIWTKVAS